MSKAKKNTSGTTSSPADAGPDAPQTEAGSANGNGTAEAWTEEGQFPEDPTVDLTSRMRDELALSQDRLLRLRAEFDNYRRRTQQDTLRLREQAVERVVLTLLPALDDLERVARPGTGLTDLDALRRGLDLVLAKFHAQLEQVDVRAFESRGQLFDPARHEALTTQRDENQAEDYVLDELVRGYRRGDVVIRHAQVVVNKH